MRKGQERVRLGDAHALHVDDVVLPKEADVIARTLEG